MDGKAQNFKFMAFNIEYMMIPYLILDGTLPFFLSRMMEPEYYCREYNGFCPGDDVNSNDPDG
jgi:hypothetical protein